MVTGKVAVEATEGGTPVLAPNFSKVIGCPIRSEGPTLAESAISRGEEAQLVTTPKILFVPGAILFVSSLMPVRMKVGK